MNNDDYAKILQQLADNTYAAKTIAPHQLPEWRVTLLQTRADFAARDEGGEAEVAFMEDLLAILDDQPLKLPANIGYGNVVWQILNAIQQYHRKGEA